MDEVESLETYFNSDDYKRIRRQMLRGERPPECSSCFYLEDHGSHSIRHTFNENYKSDIGRVLKKTDDDGYLSDPEISYLHITMGNRCNLKCQMCQPMNSHGLIKDWTAMGFNDSRISEAIKISQDNWYETDNFLNLLTRILPTLKTIFITGGEPLILKAHRNILRLIVDSGHASHILLRYNSNQTLIPREIVDLWEGFGRIAFNCSVEAYGRANDYIRYPSRWPAQEKNIFYLDKLASLRDNFGVEMHTTLSAYTIAKIPQLLDFLRYGKFQAMRRIPFFIWVISPRWLTPSVLPVDFRAECADSIERRLDLYRDFFLGYDELNARTNENYINRLVDFCAMMRNEKQKESNFDEFIEKTRAYDALRKHNVADFIPELSRFFPEEFPSSIPYNLGASCSQGVGHPKRSVGGCGAFP